MELWKRAALPEQAERDRGAWLRATVASEFELSAEDATVVQLKGFGARMDHAAVMEATRLPLADARVVVVDGDWYKPDSFVAAAEHVLARPGAVLVLFRKDTPPDHTVWTTYAPVLRATGARALHVVVPEAALARARTAVARYPGVTHVDNTALGYLTLTACDATRVVAVGGGETTVNEYRVCTQRGTAGRWALLDVPRGDEHSALFYPE